MSCHRTLVENIIKYRKFKGLTQEALANKAGLDPSYLGKIERLEISSSLETYEKICEALGTCVQYLSIQGIYEYFDEYAIVELREGKYTIKDADSQKTCK